MPTTKRRETIRQIITQQSIEKQGQLLGALAEYGIQCTQATLSRDIKAMGIIKQAAPDGHYRYALPAAPDSSVKQKMHTILRESVQSAACAQNIVVVKTLSGMANAAGAVLDELHIEQLVGTLAGDNTVFLAMTDNAAAQRFVRELERLLGRT